MKRALLALALLLAACDTQAPLSCYGPDSCGGNACCFQVSFNFDQSIYCTNSPSQCASGGDQNGNILHRLCRTDNDCTIGLSDNAFTKCCAASIQSRSARSCQLPNYCFNPASSDDDTDGM